MCIPCALKPCCADNFEKLNANGNYVGQSRTTSGAASFAKEFIDVN
jgi:hypothetical protein